MIYIRVSLYLCPHERRSGISNTCTPSRSIHKLIPRVMWRSFGTFWRGWGDSSVRQVTERWSSCAERALGVDQMAYWSACRRCQGRNTTCSVLFFASRVAWAFVGELLVLPWLHGMVPLGPSCPANVHCASWSLDSTNRTGCRSSGTTSPWRRSSLMLRVWMAIMVGMVRKTLNELPIVTSGSCALLYCQCTIRWVSTREFHNSDLSCWPRHVPFGSMEHAAPGQLALATTERPFDRSKNEPD